MKTNKQILILFFFFFIGATILSAQSKKEYNPEVIEKIVASGDYKINVGTYMPPSGEYIELDYPENSIEIKNDSVFSDLFFVEESDIPYSGRGNELRLQVTLKKYTTISSIILSSLHMIIKLAFNSPGRALIFQYGQRLINSTLRLLCILMEGRLSMFLCNTIKV